VTSVNYIVNLLIVKDHVISLGFHFKCISNHFKSLRKHLSHFCSAQLCKYRMLLYIQMSECRYCKLNCDFFFSFSQVKICHFYWLFLLLPCLVCFWEHKESMNVVSWMIYIKSWPRFNAWFYLPPIRVDEEWVMKISGFQALDLVTSCQLILRWQEFAVNKHVCLCVSYRLAILTLCKMLHISFSMQLVLPKCHLSQITEYLFECLVFSFRHVSGADFYRVYVLSSYSRLLLNPHLSHS